MRIIGTRNPVHVSQFSFQGLICDIFAIGFAIFWNMLYAKTDLLWVMGADTIISFFSAWDHETLLIWLSRVVVYLMLNTLKNILLF